MTVTLMMFQSTYTRTTPNIQKSLEKGSTWVIDSFIDHTISISKYKPLAGSSNINLPKELNHPRKGLINIQNDDNECFKACVPYFLSIFYFPPNDSPSKTMKNVFHFI